MRRQSELQRLRLRAHHDEQRVVGDAIAVTVRFFNGVAREPQGYRTRLTIVPVVVAHFRPVRTEPDQVANLRAADAPPLKELSPPQNRMLVKQPSHQAREFQ